MARNQPKTIVVTGTTRGLGLAMVEKFIEMGHTVLGCGRNREAVETLRHRYQGAHDFGLVDVARESQVEPWAARLLSSRGAPDLLINNAAVINQNTPLWQVPADEFDQLVDVNIKGVANVIRHFVPAMVAAQIGDHRQFQQRLGPLRGGGGGTLLRQQMGHRRLDAGAGGGTAARHGRGAAQSWRRRHRHASQLLRRLRVTLSGPKDLGGKSSAVYFGHYFAGQWQADDGARLNYEAIEAL